MRDSERDVVVLGWCERLPKWRKRLGNHGRNRTACPIRKVRVFDLVVLASGAVGLAGHLLGPGRVGNLHEHGEGGACRIEAPAAGVATYDGRRDRLRRQWA